MQTPTITSRKTIREGGFLSLTELTLTHPDASTSAYEVVERNSKKVFGIVSILPITEAGDIIMIRQYRAPLDRIQLELPAGCAEVGKHNTFEDAVHAELREETGYVSDDIAHIAEFSSSSGMTSETVHGFVAENCRQVSDILDLDDGEYIERLLVPIGEWDRMIFAEIARGNIIEPKMLAMLYLWKNIREK